MPGKALTLQKENFSFCIINLLYGLNEVDSFLIEEIVQDRIKSKRECEVNLGGRPKTNLIKERLVIRLRKEGCSYRSIRDQTGLALSTIRRIIVDEKLFV